jgi:hypothetical protein
MSLATHKAAIVALLNAVTNIGRVHSFERYVREEAPFRSLYLFTPAGGSEHLRGWWLRNTAISEMQLGVGRTLNEYSFELRGFMALKDADATETIFDELIEALRARYRLDPTLGGVNLAEPLGSEDGIQKDDAGPVTFCNVLCHSALLTLKTREYV